MFLHFVVLGKPVGTNNAYRRRGNAAGFYLTKEAVGFKKELRAWATRATVEQDWKKPDLKKYCSVAITVWNCPRFDVDSPIKFILDSMQGVVYDNDRCIRQVIACKESDKAQPRVEISVRYAP